MAATVPLVQVAILPFLKISLLCLTTFSLFCSPEWNRTIPHTLKECCPHLSATREFNQEPKTSQAFRLDYCRACRIRTSPHTSKVWMLPLQHTLVLIVRDGRIELPLYSSNELLSRHLKYDPELLWVLVDSNHSPKDLFYRQTAVSERLSVPN